MTRKPITHQKAVLLRPCVLLVCCSPLPPTRVTNLLCCTRSLTPSCYHTARSGEVILESCVKTLVTPTMKCPITGKTLRKKDVIKLTAGGTGFSSHNKVEAKVYRPNLI